MVVLSGIAGLLLFMVGLAFGEKIWHDGRHDPKDPLPQEILLMRT